MSDPIFTGGLRIRVSGNIRGARGWEPRGSRQSSGRGSGMKDASASGASGSVVCGTNFTPAADRALAAALHLGVALGARVVLVHVVRKEAERAAARQRLEAYARQHA